MGSMLPYIAAPWILWDIEYPQETQQGTTSPTWCPCVTCVLISSISGPQRPAAETEKPLLDAPGDNAVSLVDLYRFIYGNYIIYILYIYMYSAFLGSWFPLPTSMISYDML